MTSDRVPAANLRVGHAEREAVAAMLQEAAAAGRIDLDELDQRLGVALQAKTYGDLEPLVADLSVDPPWRAGAGSDPAKLVTSGPPTYGPPPAGYSREDPLRLDGGVGTIKRYGSWTLPPYLRISSGAGSVQLNCLQATVAAPVIEVEVIPGAGSILIVVPDGWAADDDRLASGFGTKSIKVTRTPTSAYPLLVFYGGVGMGSLKVRPGSGRELRRAGGQR